MDNKLSYDKTSGYGECQTLEMECIRKFFGRVAHVEPVYDRERQIMGIDYVVYFAGGEKCYVDAKIHHYDSRLLVYEFGDTRPNYKDHCWTNGEHSSNYILWIVPASNEAHLYKYEDICAFSKSNEWNLYAHRDYMNCIHKDGTTLNKWLPLNFIQNRTIKFDMSKYDVIIKHSKYSL